MAINYEYRFELKPGKFVYLQTKDARADAKVSIKRVLKRYKPHRIFYHLGKRGGHIAAMRYHEGHRYFSRYDLDNFFGHVTRTKLTRSLVDIGFKRDRAFELARDAVVVEGGRKILPFGFRQSPLLATLALEKSALGRFLIDQDNNPLFRVSVYMDDILISSNIEVLLDMVSLPLQSSSEISGFPIARGKFAEAVRSVEVFNCRLSEAEISILNGRMDEFVQAYTTTGDNAQQAIARYIKSVSDEEFERFRLLLP